MTSGAVDFISAYAAYLAISTIASVVVRIRHNILMTHYILAFPTKWPHLFREVKAHRRLLLEGPTLVYVTSAVCLLAALGYARFILYPHASLSPEDLAGRPLTALILLGFMVAVLFVDLRIVAAAPGYDPKKFAGDLDRANKWLGGGPIRGLFQRFARKRVKRHLSAVVLELNRWLRRRVVQLALQFLLALALWIAWFQVG